MSRYRLIMGMTIALVLVAYLGFTLGSRDYLIPGASLEAPPTVLPPTSARPAPPGGVVATASIVPQQHAALAFPIVGRIAEVLVKEGDAVKKGEVIARLDTSVLDAQVAQAQSALDVARQQLTQVQQGAADAERAAAEAALVAAQKNYAQVKAGPTLDDLAAVKANLDNATAAVAQAQAAYDRIGGDSNPASGMATQRLALQQAENTYAAALAAYRSALTHPTEAELSAALEQVKAAEERVALLTPRPSTVAIAQAQVRQADAALGLAQADRANAMLIAPFDGTVVQVVPSAGEVVTPGATVIVIGDLSQLQAQTTGLADVDVPNVKVGQEVNVSVDAFPGRTFHGQVVAIAPIANDSHGQQVYTVKANLQEGISDGLRWGMVAKVEIAANGGTPGVQ